MVDRSPWYISSYHTVSYIFYENDNRAHHIYHAECAPGKHQPNSNAPSASCKFCSKATEFVNASVSCSECLPGQFQDKNDMLFAVCKGCEKGTRFLAQDQPCISCDSGTVQPESNVDHAVCKACPRGREFAGFPDVECTTCAPGLTQITHETRPNATCEACPKGFAYINESFCELCSAGLTNQFSARPFATCHACPAGKTAENGSSGCMSCAVGKYSDGQYQRYHCNLVFHCKSIFP